MRIDALWFVYTTEFAHNGNKGITFSDGIVLCVMVAVFRRHTLQRRKSAFRRRIRERMARQAAQEHELT